MLGLQVVFPPVRHCPRGQDRTTAPNQTLQVPNLVLARILAPPLRSVDGHLAQPCVSSTGVLEMSPASPFEAQYHRDARDNVSHVRLAQRCF